MSRLDAVLRDARLLPPEERETLVLQIRRSLGELDDTRTERELLEELARISAAADEHPERLVDWEDAEEEIFGLADDV